MGSIIGWAEEGCLGHQKAGESQVLQSQVCWPFVLPCSQHRGWRECLGMLSAVSVVFFSVVGLVVCSSCSPRVVCVCFGIWGVVSRGC